MSSYTPKNFSPYANYTVAATATSQDITVAQPPFGIPANALLIQNGTSYVAFFSFGTTTQTATVASSFPILPGAIMTIDAGQTPVTHVGVILAPGGTGTVYVSTGYGA